jgi:hypothetical protein
MTRCRQPHYAARAREDEFSVLPPVIGVRAIAIGCSLRQNTARERPSGGGTSCSSPIGPEVVATISAKVGDPLAWSIVAARVGEVILTMAPRAMPRPLSPHVPEIVPGCGILQS